MMAKKVTMQADIEAMIRDEVAALVDETVSDHEFENMVQRLAGDIVDIFGR